MKFELTKFLIRYEKAIPFILFILFLLMTVPGISWGTPALWNVDELYWRVNKALGGELIFDETEPDFNYPSLPKHVMYAVSWSVRELGGNASQMIVSARLISVILGGLTVLLVYYLARILSKNIYIHLLAAVLTLSNMILVHNARFAHNDLYLLFFITLSLFALVKYRLSENRLWIYLAFFSIGCATSSKYTGATFGLVAVVIYLITNRQNLFKNWLRTIETITISFVLTVAGYVVGTPKALLWMSYYFKRMVPAALRNASYGRTPDALPGVFGQWDVFRSGVGSAVFYLFIAALIWHIFKLVGRSFQKPIVDEDRNKAISVVLLAIIIFNIPYLFSYNYQSR
ncbi:MAG: phospholipid carrier-dependent glycosyltransferase, partial [Anaerolineales bacterium]